MVIFHHVRDPSPKGEGIGHGQDSPDDNDEVDDQDRLEHRGTHGVSDEVECRKVKDEQACDHTDSDRQRIESGAAPPTHVALPETWDQSR